MGMFHELQDDKNSVGRALYRSCGDHVFKARLKPEFFSGFLLATAQVVYITAMAFHVFRYDLCCTGYVTQRGL